MTLTQTQGKRGAAWRLDTIERGRRVRRMFKSLTEAQGYLQAHDAGGQGHDKAARANAAQASAQPCAMSIATLFKKWLAHCDSLRKHSRQYQLVRGCYINSMHTFFTERGITEVDQITRGLFDEYIAWRTAAGASMSTVRKDYSIITAALSYGVTREHIARNPIAGYFRGVRVVEKSITVPMPDELRRVMAALPHEDTRRLFWFLCATGCRITEAIELQAADVAGDCIRFHRGCKGGYERHAPAPAFPFEIPSAGLVFTLHGNPWRRDTFMHTLWKACQRAGVARFSPHTLRHAHATYKLAGGEPVYNLMASCGWRSLSIVQRYVSISRRYQNAGEFIPRWVGVFLAVCGSVLGRKRGTREVKPVVCVGLRYLHTVEVTGSNPVAPTIENMPQCHQILVLRLFYSPVIVSFSIGHNDLFMHVLGTFRH